jgi:hypothetical protein
MSKLLDASCAYLVSTSRSRSAREFSRRKISPSSAEKDLAMVLRSGQSMIPDKSQLGKIRK